MAKINKKKIIKKNKSIQTKTATPSEALPDKKFSKVDEFIYSCFMFIKKVWITFYSWWHPKKFTTKSLIIFLIITLIFLVNITAEINAHSDIIYQNLIASVNKEPYDMEAVRPFATYLFGIIFFGGSALLMVIIKMFSSVFNSIKTDYDPLKESIKEARKQVKLKL